MFQRNEPIPLIFCTSVSAITCPSLGTFANGQITYSIDITAPHNFGTVAIFSCNTGFSLSGGSTRTCGGDGSSENGVWSGSSPVCVGELLQVLQTNSSVSACLVVSTRPYFACVSLSVCLL